MRIYVSDKSLMSLHLIDRLTSSTGSRSHNIKGFASCIEVTFCPSPTVSRVYLDIIVLIHLRLPRIGLVL